MSRGFITKFLRKKGEEEIFFRFWPGKKEMPVLILLHDLGGHSLRFEYLTDYFQKLGFNIYAFDFAGFGKSQEYKGHIEDFTVYLNETLSMLKLSKIEFPKNNKFIFGDGMGALVAVLFAKYYQQFLDGLVLLSPAVKTKIHVTNRKMYNTFLNTLFNKLAVTDIPFTKEMLTNDFKTQKKLQHDAMDVKTTTVAFNMAFDNARSQVRKFAYEINIPVLTLAAEKDLLLDLDATKEVFNMFNSKVKEMMILDDFYHSITLDKNRDYAFELITRWIYKILFIQERQKFNS